MKWYYHIAGGHTHVKVFMNGAKCGDLCFRNEEFEYIRRTVHNRITDFIEENYPPLPNLEPITTQLTKL